MIKPQYVADLEIAKIDVDPQIRMRNGFDDEGIKELAASILLHGLLQPIVVRRQDSDVNRFTLVAGHRRLDAIGRLLATEFGLSVPAVILPATEEKAYLAQLAENVQRQDLTLADESYAIWTLSNIYPSQTLIAEAVHKSASWVSKRLSLQQASPAVLQLLNDGYSCDLEFLLALEQLGELPEGKQEFTRLWSAAHNREDGLRTQARAAIKKIKDGKKSPKPAEAAKPDSEVPAAESAPACVNYPIPYELVTQINARGGIQWLLALIREELKTPA